MNKVLGQLLWNDRHDCNKNRGAAHLPEHISSLTFSCIGWQLFIKQNKRCWWGFMLENPNVFFSVKFKKKKFPQFNTCKYIHMALQEKSVSSFLVSCNFKLSCPGYLRVWKGKWHMVVGGWGSSSFFCLQCTLLQITRTLICRPVNPAPSFGTEFSRTCLRTIPPRKVVSSLALPWGQLKM